LIADDAAELNRLPFVLDGIIRCVDDRGMYMKLGVYRLPFVTGDGPRRSVHMLRPDHIAAHPVRIAAISSDPRLNGEFYFRHGFANRVLHGGKNAAIALSVFAAHFQSETNRFWCIKCHVREYAPVVSRPRGELLFGHRIRVVAEPQET